MLQISPIIDKILIIGGITMNELLAGIGHDQISKMDRPERHGSERAAKNE